MLVSKYSRTNLDIEMVKNNCDEIDKPPSSYRVTRLDFCSLIYSIFFHFVDVGFDFYVAYSYYTTERYSYFAWTAAFIVIPTVIITLISIRMYWDDREEYATPKYAFSRIFLCVFGLGFQSALLIRYCDSLRFAIKSWQGEKRSDRRQQEKYFHKMLNENSDVALLRVFECYLESAPQQVLQMTLLLIDYSQGSDVHKTTQTITITLGFLAMGWCMANYHRSIRLDQEDKQNISVTGVILQFFWQLSFTVSRILALAAIGTLYPLWTVVSVASHWFIMTVWVAICSRTNFCGRHRIYEIFFSCAIGLIYIFNFVSFKEGPTRYSYLFFYLLCFSENLVMTTIWGLKSTSVIKNWFYYVLLILPVLCFVFSVIFLLIYYGFLHPNRFKFKSEKNKIQYGNNLQNNANELKVTLTDEDNGK